MTDGWEKTARGWRKSYTPPRVTTARADFPCPRVVTDTMPPIEHVDGQTYESKSAFRAVTKARGYIEVGNDPARLRPGDKPRQDSSKLDAAIHRAIAEVNA